METADTNVEAYLISEGDHILYDGILSLVSLVERDIEPGFFFVTLRTWDFRLNMATKTKVVRFTHNESVELVAFGRLS